ncbi:uncharacterized protein KD926_004339 [Aspergillus affinis]|uniref:uncharacterized protein n=1 Tax=Aspergillus affinis TaxID=1070780 RepID=UPI0022FE7C29|nr:uncharacterized protein KD926_004339 [Aspergillus affinis]KAI9043156.1 hypothetical protein KD926_004339 [Aspergillus affinis]
MAKALNLEDDSTFICYTLGTKKSDYGKIIATDVQIATAIPSLRVSRKRGADGRNVSYPVHARWLLANPRKALQNFAQATISPVLLADYLSTIVNKGIRNTGPCRDNNDLQYGGQIPGLQLCVFPFHFPVNLCKSLFAFSLAADVYENLQGATIPLTLVNKPLYESRWLPSPFYQESKLRNHTIGKWFDYSEPAVIPAKPQPLDLAKTFPCIARFENGTSDVDLADLESALALASGESILVAAIVLSDPFDSPAPHSIRRIVGIIGRPGISILVAPQHPKIRKPTDSFNVISHLPYDFLRDNFRSTSLHLSFTEWKLPLSDDEEQTIDQDVMMVESVISVLDRALANCDPCSGHEPAANQSPTGDIAHSDYFSVDNWDELLDAPEVGIVRAHGNWAARLAAVSILYQQGQGHSIGVFGPEKVCFQCFQAQQSHIDSDLFEENEALLPSFCID